MVLAKMNQNEHFKFKDLGLPYILKKNSYNQNTFKLK
jgi:hypothetical protein